MEEIEVYSENEVRIMFCIKKVYYNGLLVFMVGFGNVFMVGFWFVF